MKTKEIADSGVRNIIYATIGSAVNDWKKSAAFLCKETGVNPLKVDSDFSNRYRCNKRIISRVKDLKDAELFFIGSTYEFYGKTLDCYIEPDYLLRELYDRVLEDILK